MEDVKISQMSVHLGAWTATCRGTNNDDVPSSHVVSFLAPQSSANKRHSFARCGFGLSAALQLGSTPLRPVSHHFSTLRLFFTEKTPETPLA